MPWVKEESAGRVADSSGDAGATVTATSPAMLVKELTAQTDSSGEYKFVCRLVPTPLTQKLVRKTCAQPGFHGDRRHCASASMKSHRASSKR